MATYRREYVNCGKPGCTTCGGSAYAHGPYWYAYWREKVRGQRSRTRKVYVGKHWWPGCGTEAPGQPPPPKPPPEERDRARERARGRRQPPPPPPPSQWWTVLGVDRGADWNTIRRVYRRMAYAAHPDRGGSHLEAVRINVAFDAAKAAHGR
jgi:hypothetical protein